MIGIALVGAGFIADFHLAGLAAIPDARVRVIASRSADRAVALAGRFGVPEVTEDVMAGMRRPDVDAVVITTPDDTHEALAIEALRAGKAVLLQKPMAGDAGACRRILETAARTRRDVQVSFMHRHFGEVAAARAMLREGSIGRVATVRQRNATPGPAWGDWFFRKDRVPGGVVSQLGVHGIDLVEHVFGPIVAVSARTATCVPRRVLANGQTVDVENADTAFAVYEIEQGPIVHHEMSMIEAAGTDRYRMEMYGSLGTLWLRTEHGLLARAGGAAWESIDVPQADPGTRLHRQWIDSLMGRIPSPQTGLAGLRAMLVAQAIALSADAGGRRVLVEAV
ncbi:Gfo/Idh/MocA family protein [Alsobacter sp. R-9]